MKKFILIFLAFDFGVFLISFLTAYVSDSNNPVKANKSAAAGSFVNETDSNQAILTPSAPDFTESAWNDTGSEISRQKQVKELLAELERADSRSEAEFAGRRNKNLLTYNATPTPDPYEDNLIAAVSDYVITPKPSYTPELENILAEETARNFSNEALGRTSNEKTEPVDFVYTEEQSAQGKPFEYSQGKQSNNETMHNIGDIKENPIKSTLVIALLGDSMVSTLGESLPDLSTLLKQSFPNYSFALLNYGQGATDLASGLFRLTHTTKYLGKTYPPLLSYKPDILTVESFAYNPWSANGYDLDRQWLTIAQIIDTVKEISPATKIILAASIAPDPLSFGDGSLNWTADAKWQKAQTVKAYLANLVNFATTENYPLADAFHPSLNPDGRGNLLFINKADHIHPSEEGKKLFSEKIVEAIRANKLIAY